MPGQWARVAGVSGGAFLQPIASPLVLSGFTPAAFRQFAPDWEAYGMMATPGGSAEPQADDAQITAGDMISMVLVQGDLSMSAACTVTAVTDDRVYACGHPLFGLGGVQHADGAGPRAYHAGLGNGFDQDRQRRRRDRHAHAGPR